MYVCLLTHVCLRKNGAILFKLIKYTEQYVTVFTNWIHSAPELSFQSVSLICLVSSHLNSTCPSTCMALSSHGQVLHSLRILFHCLVPTLKPVWGQAELSKSYSQIVRNVGLQVPVDHTACQIRIHELVSWSLSWCGWLLQALLFDHTHALHP